VGWLATIASYAGGGWTGDWFEHWERARFFLEHQPLTQKFLGNDSLTARPPLANVVTGALLFLTRVDFAHYQLASTLLASLVFLPAALLARRFGRDARAIALCAALFLVNPLLVQNATFAWTKLPTAAFVLTGLYFFLRGQERGAPLSTALLCALSLGAGLLTHYSAGPYVVMLAAGWLGLGWSRRREPEWQRATGYAIFAGAAVLALWFGWALANYGVHETFLANSSVADATKYPGSQLAKVLLNVRDTLVPHFLRSPDRALIAQSSPWGWWSDWAFQCYQLNLPLACGSVAWLAIAWELGRSGRTAPPRVRRFWGAFVSGVVLLGVASHGARDEWGLAHICLQALVLLGLAFLAARWSTLARGWRLALIAGATLDLAVGIVLHNGIQSLAVGRLFASGPPTHDVQASFSGPTFMNFQGKHLNHLAFFSEVLTAPPALVLAALAAILMLAGLGARPPSPRVP
jgi:4-amino-4-deoxy-L-arabinose transferase-like glycosyltransferase